MKKIVFASSNEYKIREYESVFLGLGASKRNDDIQFSARNGFDIEEINSGNPLMVIAIKARDTWEKMREAGSLIADECLLVEDTVLWIADEGIVDEHVGNKLMTPENIDQWEPWIDIRYRLKELEQMSGRASRFQVNAALVSPEGGMQIFIREQPGKIQMPVNSDEAAYGFDALFIPSGSDQSLADMSPEEQLRFKPRHLLAEAIQQGLRPDTSFTIDQLYAVMNEKERKGLFEKQGPNAVPPRPPRDQRFRR